MAKWHTSIELPGDPSVPLGATPKQYVDNGLALKAPLASPPLTGVPTAPTAAVDTATTQLATTLYVTNQAGSSNPLMNGAVAVGTSLRYSRQDHVHPVDTSRLAASAYTAADVLAKLITVDGVSSALDSDLLDGQHGAYYLDLTNATGTLPAARMPALTGDVTTSAGGVATTIANSAVSLAKMANVATGTFLGRATASTGVVEALSVAAAKTLLALVKADVGLSAVENTALSTWAGSANITTVGTIATGVWSGTAIADNKIASALTGKTYNGLTLTAVAVGFTIAGGTTSKTLTVADNASVSGTNTGDQTIALTGDVTGSGTGSFAATIANNAVTLAKMATVATASFLGRNTAGTGNVEVLSVATAKTLLALVKADVGLGNVENTALSTWTGSANITTLGTIATGVWSGTAIADNKIASALTGKTYNGLTLTAQTVGFTIAGGTTSKTLTVGLDASVSGTNTGDQTITLTGDVTGSGTGSFAATIANSAVTLAKMANVATATFLGRTTAGTGVVEAMTAAQAVALLPVATNAAKGLMPAGGTSALLMRGDYTFNNAVQGNVAFGSGSAVSASGKVRSNGTTGVGSSFGFIEDSVVAAGTTAFYSYYAQADTAAGDNVTGSMDGYYINDGVLGAGSILTNYYGHRVVSLTIGTNNYGFISTMAIEPGGVDPLTGFTARTITNISVSGNVVTVTTSVAHGYVAAQHVTVNATTNTVINGSKITIVSVPTPTTFTYALTTANIASTADTGTVTPNRRWSFYSSGTANSYHAGSWLIGSSSWNGYDDLQVLGSASFGSRAVIGTTSVSAVQGPILTLNTLVAGSGYTNGTYTQVALTGGTGAGATADITVAGGVVTACVLNDTGARYTAGDVLSADAATIGGTGTGFSITSNTVEDVHLLVGDSTGGIIRLELNDTSLAANQRIGALLFGTRDLNNGAAGDLAWIEAQAISTSGGSKILFYTALASVSKATVALTINGDNTVVGAGTFTAPGFIGPLTGNASTATALATARSIALAGVITASGVNFDGTGNISLTTAIADGALSIAKTTGLQTALDAKANLASPPLTGTPTAPTASPGTNNTQIATTGYVDAAIAAAAAAGVNFTYSETAPSSPTPGDQWFKPTHAVTYTWINDGDSSQWVDLSSSVVAGTETPVYIQPDQPPLTRDFLWVQTGLGSDGEGFTLWFNKA